MVSCTCSLWLKISSRALNLWSCKYSERQETGMPKNEKGKPSLFLLLGHVNSNPAVLQCNKGCWCLNHTPSSFAMAIPQIPSSSTDLLGFHGQLELGLWEKFCFQPSCLFLSLQAWHNRPHSAIIPTSSASPGESLESQHRPSGQQINHCGRNCTSTKCGVCSLLLLSFLLFFFWHKSSVWHKKRIKQNLFVHPFSITNFTFQQWSSKLLYMLLCNASQSIDPKITTDIWWGSWAYQPFLPRGLAGA